MNIFPIIRIPLTKPRLLVASMTWLIAALLSVPAFAAPPSPSNEAQSRSARTAEADQMLKDSYTQFRDSRAKTIAEYKAKQAECDKLQDNAKKTCSKEAKATRKQALKAASKAHNQSLQEAYLKAPELRPVAPIY